MNPDRLGISGQLLSQAKTERRSVFIGYLPVGFPNVADSLTAMQALVEGHDGLGADIVEIGIVAKRDSWPKKAWIYIAQTDTYIEKDSAINDDVERLRHRATSSLL